jgi:hypothetical protein
MFEMRAQDWHLVMPLKNDLVRKFCLDVPVPDHMAMVSTLVCHGHIHLTL